jgi:succinate dehydrogenase/fumarate reductase flavoprotein subunit
MTERIANQERRIETDVLVLGAGAAGCGAAIGAREGGSNVLLVEKGKIESSGCLGAGNDHFMANLNSGPDWDTDAALLKFLRTMNRGVTAAMIDNGLIKVLPLIIRLLESVGLEFLKNADGSYLRTSGFGQTATWWLNIKNGQFAKRFLAKKLRASGIDVLDYVMVTRLIGSENRVFAAMGFNVLDGTVYILKAKSVVLALGSHTPRATTNSTHNPFNTWQYPYNTGCYCALAYDAGAKLINLDTDHPVSLLPKGFGCSGMNALNSMGGHELNALGERFMSKYDPMGENGVRKNQVLGTFQEMIEGKGPPFYMDMRHLTPGDRHLLQHVLMPGDKATFNDYMSQKGLDFSTHPLEVELSEINFGGRLLSRDNFESTVSGLFSGCNFGGFSGALCGGYSAGKEAARAAHLASQDVQLNEDEIEAEKKLIFRPLKVEDGLTPQSFENAIRQVMDFYMGIVKNESGIDIALERLDLIQGYLSRLQAHNFHELMRANEARFLLKQCQLTTRAVKERRESGRTTYRRSDYPNLDPKYNGKSLALWQESGKAMSAFIPAP